MYNLKIFPTWDFTSVESELCHYYFKGRISFYKLTAWESFKFAVHESIFLISYLSNSTFTFVLTIEQIYFINVAMFIIVIDNLLYCSIEEFMIY